MDDMLMILLILYSTIFIAGFTGNLIMVMVTIYSKNLRSICNILICISCLFDLLLYTDILTFVISMFWPVTQELCFYMNIPAVIGGFSSNAAVLIVGIDRLIAVTMPTKYKLIELSKYHYLAFLLVFPAIYSACLLYIAVGQRDPNTYVTCLLPVAIGYAYNVFASTSFIINLFVPPIYIYVFYKIKKSRFKTSMRAVFKSLAVTVTLVISGWMTTDLIGVLTVTIEMDPDLARMIQLYCGTFIFTSSSFNVVVFYTMCKDYQNAIRAMFGLKPHKVMMFQDTGTEVPTTTKRTKTMQTTVF